MAEFGASEKQRSLRKTMLKKMLNQGAVERRSSVVGKDTVADEQREQWKRDLAGRANGTLDPWYLCDLFDEVFEYALNFTFPWSKLLFRDPLLDRADGY